MEERCKHKITSRRVIKKKTEVLDEKPLYGPPSRNDPVVNKVGVLPSKPNLPNVLELSEFQLPTGFIKPCLH